MAERVDLDDDSLSNTYKSRFGRNGNNRRHGEGRSAQNGSNHWQGSNNAHHQERNHEQPLRHPSPRRFGQPAYGRRTNQRPSGSSFCGNTPVNHRNRFEQKPRREDKKRTTLSKREKEELCAVGKCFCCKEPRHISCNCPTANHIKASSSSRKPPGLGSYSICLNLAEMECQYESTLADTLAGMRLNALSFVLEDVGVKASWVSLFCRSINQYLHTSIWTTTGVCIPRANMDHNWYSLCPRYEQSQGFQWSWALVSRQRLEVREWSQRGN